MNYSLQIAHHQLIFLQQCRMYPVIPALLKIACWAVYLLVHCSTSRFVYNTNLASVRFHGHPCPFWNYKARVKNNRRRAFCTLRIVFSSGTDADRIKQKQVWHWSNLCSAKYMDVLRWTSNAVDGMHIFKRPCTFPFLPLYYFYAEFQDRITTVSIIFSQRAKKDAKGTWHT